MAAQADKVTQYSNWASLKANQTKTTVTCILHKTSPQHPTHSKTITNMLTHKPIEVQGLPIKCTQPKEPFKFLGVWFTMGLDWKKQWEETVKDVKQSVRKLHTSLLNTSQKVRTINTCLRRRLAYPMAIAPYTYTQIHALDSCLTKAIKQAYGLTPSTGTAFAHEEAHKGGLGFPSLATEYYTTLIQSLTRALNDETRLGDISRTLLDQQAQAMQRTRQTGYLYTQSMRLRQLHALHGTQLGLRKGDEPYMRDASYMDLTTSIKTLARQIHGAVIKVPPQVLKAITKIAKAGYTDLTDLIRVHDMTMIPASQLRGLGKHNRHTNLRKAINLLTQYLPL